MPSEQSNRSRSRRKNVQQQNGPSFVQSQADQAVRAVVRAALGDRLSAQTPSYRHEQSIENGDGQNCDRCENKGRNSGDVSHFKKRSRTQQEPDEQAAGIAHEDPRRTEIEHKKTSNRPRSQRNNYSLVTVSAADIKDGQISG